MDTSGARADLNALYGDMRRAPAITLPGGGVVGGGFPMGSMLGAVAMGTVVGNGVSSLLNSQAIRGLTGTLLDELLSQAIGPGVGGFLGATGSRSAVASRFAPLVGMGLMKPDDPLLKQMFDFEQQFGAGASARGGAQIRAAMGGETNEAMIDAIAKGFGHLLTEFIPQLAEAIGSAIANKLNPFSSGH